MTDNSLRKNDTEVSHLFSKIAALEQLLEVYENSVIEHADKLYREIVQNRLVNEELEYRNVVLSSQQIIGRTLDMNEFLPEVLQNLTKTRIFRFKIIKAAIYIVKDEKFRLASFISLSETDSEHCSEIRHGECLCGIAVTTGEVVISKNSTEDKRHTISYPNDNPHGHIIVPLKSGGKITGVLCLFIEPDIEVTENQIKVISS